MAMRDLPVKGVIVKKSTSPEFQIAKQQLRHQGFLVCEDADGLYSILNPEDQWVATGFTEETVMDAAAAVIAVDELRKWKKDHES